MKNILWRIRCWLIRKLGGFDRQQIITERVFNTTVSARPVRIVQELRLFDGSSPEQYNHAKRYVAEGLAAELLRRDMIQFESRRNENDLIACETVLRGTVYLVPPRAAAFLDVLG